MELFLLRQGNLTGIETLQVGHLTVQLGQTYQRIDFIGQQNGFLLADVLLGCRHLDKEVRTGDGRPRGAYFARSTLLVLLTATLAVASCFARDLDMQLVRLYILTTCRNMCCRDGKRTVFSG